MWRLLPRLGDVFLRVLSDHSTTLGAVPDPHGQFPGAPLCWHAAETIPKQPDGPPPGHPDNR